MKQKFSNIFVLTLVAMILMLAGCGSEDKTADKETAQPKTETAVAAETAATEPTQAETAATAESTSMEKKETRTAEATTKATKAKKEPTKEKKKESTKAKKKETTKENKKAIAQKYVGKSVDSLISAVGSPKSRSYASSCMGDGEDGELKYSGFTVYTYRENGKETVQHIE